MASEKVLDRAFEAAVSSDKRFRHWFLSRTKLGDGYPRLVLSRSNHPWGKVSLLLPNVQTGAIEAVEREGETDILLVFEGASTERLGLHVENKRSRLTKPQASTRRQGRRTLRWSPPRRPSLPTPI